MQSSFRTLVLAVLAGIVLGGVLVLLLQDDDASVDETGFSSAVNRAAPAVVNIYTSQEVRLPICDLPRYRDMCDRLRRDGSSNQQGALGSGVVVHEDGYVLTNNHVIANADEILVGFADGTGSTARVIGRDPETDLAVIRIEREALTPIVIGNSDRVQIGDIALAIGNPFGIGQTVSQGIISAKSRAGVSASPYDDFIQTDAAINPGNSGGALINDSGELIGVNTMIFSRSGGSQGIGFAIPSNLALDVLNQIVTTGRVRRGWLGVEIATAPSSDNGMGLLVTRVFEDGPALRASLRPGDRIVAIDELPVTDTQSFSRIVADYAPGEELTLLIKRGAEVYEQRLEAGERP